MNKKKIDLKMDPIEIDGSVGEGGGQILRTACWRRLNLDHLCRLNFDQGLKLAA
jgi:hypothetical protein